MKVLPGIVADEIEAVVDDVEKWVSDLSSEFNVSRENLMGRVVHRLMEG